MRYFLTFSSLLLIAACAHHKDVRPGAEGIHKVVVQAEDPDQGSKSAISQARSYCKKRGGLEPAIVNESQKYSGDIDEQTYKKAEPLFLVAQ